MQRYYKSIYSFVIFLLLTYFSTTSYAAQTMSIDPIEQTYQAWKTAMETAKGNASKVIALYSADAVLVPTLSPNLHFNQKNQFKKYFEKLTKLPGFSISTQKIVTHVYGNIAVSNGLYTFSYIDDIDEPVSIPARFTFVYQKQDAGWLIINHHSSSFPPAID